MKSIQNQYRDLKEGRISQANFMRNLRMTMPQYVTNVTSFNDAIKILKNKAILTEAYNGGDEDAELEAMIKKMEDEKAGEEAIMSQYDPMEEELNEKSYKVSKDAISVSSLKKGDILGGSGLEVVSISAGAKTPSGKIEVTVKDPKTGNEVTKVWNKATKVTVKKDLKEAKKKKEAKAELHPNQIHPQELRMGIKVELEHTDDLDKAKKIALDHLAENPFYYTALKLAGVESPSAPKVKAPKEAKAKKKSDKIELVDLVNQMQKVKMPKADEKKKLKEARYNIMGEPNAAAKQAMQFVDGNATLKALSDDIEIQQSYDEALLRYRYWEALPAEAIEKLKLQFNVEPDSDFDEDTGEIIFYRLTPLRRNYGSKDLGASFEKFKKSLEEVVREAINEYYDGRDNLIDDIAAEID